MSKKGAPNIRLINGMTVPQVAKKTGLTTGVIYRRIERGWDDDRILSVPAKREPVYIKGMTVKEVCELTGLPSSTVRERIKMGWSDDEILNTPWGKPRCRVRKNTWADVAAQLTPQARLFCGLAN